MMWPLLLALIAPSQRCVALAPHFEGEASVAELSQMVNEIKDLGANLLLVVVQWGQSDVHDVTLAPYQWGSDDGKVRAVIQHARGRSLEVLVFPIVRLAELAPGRWRGTLAPRDREAWWQSYSRFILHYAQLGAQTGASWLSVGSELSSMEADELRWRGLIQAVRAIFPGRLTYSANWDHFTQVGFWDALDVVGMNAYHPITTRDSAEQAELVAGWRAVRRGLLLWQALLPRPLLFTEVGYPSMRGGARRPYHFAADGPVDLAEQSRAYWAFIDTWQGQPIAGACIWLWSGRGGSNDPGYMPRGKPAEALIRAWFRGEALPEAL